MDLPLTSEFDSEFILWDDEDGGTSDQDDKNQGKAGAPVGTVADPTVASKRKGNNPVSEESLGSHSINNSSPASNAIGSSLLETNTNNYFTAFADQSLSNTLNASTTQIQAAKPNENPAHLSLGSSTSTTQVEVPRAPQHLSVDQNLISEPIFPPNYFLSGLPWDPSQAVMNPQATVCKASSTQSKAKPPSASSSGSTKGQVDQVLAPLQEGQDEWNPAQMSQRIAMHPVNDEQNHNGQALAIGVNPIVPHTKSSQCQQTITDGSTNTGSSFSSHLSSSSGEGKKRSDARAKSDTNRTTPENGAAQPNQEEVPPFYLFDAPCELRANFLQAQQQHEMTIVRDSNAFHYGIAVNNFHPKSSPHVQPVMPASLGAAVLPNGKRVELIDGRHKHKRKSSERNEREQQRAQKITELIDKLRNTMEQGGWKVEMKSKYQILSTSADYLKHLIHTTKEKEVTLKKAKTELAIRNQKLEEDRVLQEGRSDPESVTSSITAFSASEANVRASRGSTEDSSTNVAVASFSPGTERLKHKILAQVGLEESEESQKKYQKPPEKPQEKTDDESNHSGHMDSNNSGSGHGGKNISIDKMSSSLSDITDSNRGSSDGQGTGSSGNDSKDMRTSFDLNLLAQDGKDSMTNSSISSTAAVVSGVGSGDNDHQHTSIIFTRGRKRKYRREKTSLDEGFQLSYQEVFLESNVPQLIATPAGRIVACNDFFFRVTGLTQRDVKRITIFSMVQVDKLSILFELVADALRRSNAGSISDNTGLSESSSRNNSSSDSDVKTIEGDINSEIQQFETATLPCVPFPQKLAGNDIAQEKHLFMNVTFMYDANPSKRCIHCALTDKSGVGGKIGTITPELLSMLFPLRSIINNDLRPTEKIR